MRLHSKQDLPFDLTEADIPAWMREYQRSWDWGLIAALLIVFLVAAPLVVFDHLPQTATVQSQVAYTIETAEGLKDGAIYPRWAADLNYGFGSPVLNYVPPLPHYSAALYTVFVHGNPVLAVSLVSAASVVILGLGIFAFVRQRWGALAGFLATGTLLFGTPIVLGTAYFEGDSPSILGAGLFLIALWGIGGSETSPSGWRISVTAAAIAGVWLADFPTNMILVVLGICWALWQAICTGNWRTQFTFLGAALLGTMLSAFYWLPATAEYGTVKWLSLSNETVNSWRQPLSDIFSPAQQFDTSAVNPESPGGIGVVLTILTIMALCWMILRAWRRAPMPAYGARGDRIQQRMIAAIHLIPEQSIAAIFFLGTGIILLALTVAPLHGLHQFLIEKGDLTSHNLVFLSGIFFSIWVGQIGWLVENTHFPMRGSVVLLVSCLLIAAGSLTTVTVPQWKGSFMPGNSSELARGTIRGYWSLSPRPLMATSAPDPSAALIASYESGAIDKILRADLPAASRVDVIRHTSRSDRIAVDTATPITLILHTFDFTGWKARVDNESVPIYRNPESGFLSIDVPAGNHEILVYFGTTPIRVAAWTMTGFAVLLTTAMMARRWRINTTSTERQPVAHTPVFQRVLLAAMVTIWATASAIPRMFPASFIHESPPGIVPEPAIQYPRQLQGGIDLLAFVLETQQDIHPGSTIDLTLFWRAVQPDLPDYQMTVHLINESGLEVASVQRRHPAFIPTSRWPNWPLLNAYFRDPYQIKTSASLPFGRYQIVITVGQCSQLSMGPCASVEPLFVRDSRGANLGKEIVLPVEVNITP